MNFDFYMSEEKKKDVFIGKLNISDCYRRKTEAISEKLHYESAMRDYYIEEIAKAEEDKQLLREIYSTLNSDQIQFIENEIKESEGGYDFKIITEKPILQIEHEKEDDDSFNTYVEQWSSYPCEDCYSGYVYLELIENKKYLKWSYSM